MRHAVRVVSFAPMQKLSGDRRSAIALLAAILIIPVVGICGLAVDFALWNQANAAMSLAANGAAMNAVKIAVASQIAGNKDYLAKGAAAGTAWFTAQVGANAYAGALSNITPSVTIVASTQTSLTAKVTLNAKMASVFGVIFSVAQYPLSLEADATMSDAPYLEVQILIDNSSSMLIGATDSDVVAIELATMCNAAGNPDLTNQNKDFSGYLCGELGYSYSGACNPMPLPVPPYPVASLTPLNPTAYTDAKGGGPSCKGWPGATQNSDGSWPTAGAPCGFACHSDGTKPAGSGRDPLGLVRAAAGTANQINLRIDVVKAAMNTLISDMSGVNIVGENNLSVSVWDFGLGLNHDYPPSGEAGSDFSAAAAAVGGAATYPNGPDTGIIPPFTPNTAPGTDFTYALTNLADQVTAAGLGITPAAPRKVLFLVTDGVGDSSAGYAPINASLCSSFKAMGYTVYVIYTPYYSVPHHAYFANAAAMTQPLGDSAVSEALLACASAAPDYVAATDQASLTTALENFLRMALAAPANFTK